jgi:hypothetical protein
MKTARLITLVVTALVLLAAGCGSASETSPEDVPLVVKQADAMQALRTWGAEHVHVTWSKGAARIANDGDQILLCGVTSTEVSYQPDHYFGIYPHRSRELAAPSSPFVRCVVQWEHAATIIGRDEHELALLFEEPSPKDRAEANEPQTHAASIVLMPDPMPNLGVQIDDRYTLLD